MPTAATPIIGIMHPHFEWIKPSPHPNQYRSKATGQHVLIEKRGSETGTEAPCYVAVPCLPDGTKLAIHVEPLAWADEAFEVLDKVHALR